MRVAITGASGNVGTALLRALPAAEVVAIARRPSPGPGTVCARTPAPRWTRVDEQQPRDGVAALTEIFAGFRLPVPRPVLAAAAFAGRRIGLLPLHPSWLKLADRACLVRAEPGSA
ncbi:hypothetical protein IU471_11810 [Nocardia elegans]|uniref:NAD-dependent epimerase/dehydratase family protein n=1 Tax=Nocardia elegans TaxID=300029 RepID=A0ABW6TC17_9NOCA|nr:hypothetical protein [Nocardia elegans]MBF6244264.1 hypothetical protein [Nocardia elegans]MBF6448078.1 hypothetical protein [Nocardia elegans]